MKTGVIDVGGGMRGSYGAGIFDWCMDNGIRFDCCIGVSAGSANVCSYLAGQRGRNLVYYTDYNLRSESMGVKNFIKTRNFVNLEYIYGTMSNAGGEYPLDFEAACANPADFIIVATSALSGKPYYFNVHDMKQDDYGAIKASCCVPAVNQAYYVAGSRYYDGGISDPIPVRKCLEEGCDKIVLILTRPKDFVRDPKKDVLTSRLIRKEFPEAARAMSRRADVYNSQLRYAKRLEQEGRLLIIAPDDIGDMSTLKRDREAIERLYYKGYHDAEAITGFLNA